LLVQTSFLGDTILSTPVISAIKTIYPQAQLWMMTTPPAADLVRRDPLLSGVVTYDKRSRQSGLFGLLQMSRKLKAMQFDKVYSLHRSFRTSLLLYLAGIPVRIGCADAKLRFLYHEVKKRDLHRHDVIRNLSILSGEGEFDPDTLEMRLHPPLPGEIDPGLVQRLERSRPYAVLVPGSAWKTKMWHWQGFRQVAQYLISRNINVVLLGAGSEQETCAAVAQGLEVINLAGSTGIAEAMYVIQQARLMVCNDSMSLHMASALKIPTVVVFCATSPEFGYGPWKNRAIVVEHPNLSCKPCRPHGSTQCPNGTEACMKDLGADDVIKAVNELIEDT
jgi:heptosyltransferase-2